MISDVYNTAVMLILLILVGCVCYGIRDLYDHDLSGAFWCAAVFIVFAIMGDDFANLAVYVTQMF